MSAAVTGVRRPAILAASARDALPVGLAILQGAVLLAAPSAWVVALGLWWNSNTVAHWFLHRPFFRPRTLNSLFALYLSVLLGIPQSVWRERHLAHHAGRPARPRYSHQVAAEISLILALWGWLLATRPTFFLTAYAPGYLAGLALCWLHGYYEHARGTTSHYGVLYNSLFFNDGYHAEHHAAPGMHWTLLPNAQRLDATVSRWPAVLRWLDALSLDGLERWVLFSPRLQNFVLSRHERAFRRVLPPLPDSPRIAIVGGGLFPRTLLVLRHLLPDAHFVVIDKDAGNLATAAEFVGQDSNPAEPTGTLRFVHAAYEPSQLVEMDLAVFPLAFVGDRPALYDRPPAPLLIVHDWVWRRRGRSTVVSLVLLKRLNLVCRCEH
jgi:hypothetical protein